MSKRVYKKKQANSTNKNVNNNIKTNNKTTQKEQKEDPKEEAFEFDENDENIILKAFQHFDTDHNGKINVEEIKHVLTFLGDIMTQEEVDKFFKSVDIDNNGCLDYREFIKFWMNNE